MHNLDRTTLEHEGNEFEAHEHEGHEFEHEGHEFEGHEFEHEGHELEGEQFLGNVVGGLFGEQEGEFEFEQEGHEFEQEMAAESPFHEHEAMELAAELLTVQSEQELNHFFGGLIKKAWGAAKKFGSSNLGKSLLGGLKGLAKKALPQLGAAVGNWVAPGVGGQIGSKLASGAGRMLGLELEGLSAEDREFEVAKQLVNLAGAAARAAVQNPACGAPPIAARNALVQAAKVYAPGVVPALARSVRIPAPVAGGARPAAVAGARPRVRGSQGRWFRRGNAIVLVGA